MPPTRAPDRRRAERWRCERCLRPFPCRRAAGSRSPGPPSISAARRSDPGRCGAGYPIQREMKAFRGLSWPARSIAAASGKLEIQGAHFIYARNRVAVPGVAQMHALAHVLDKPGPEYRHAFAAVAAHAVECDSIRAGIAQRAPELLRGRIACGVI